jgi:hypothetical protein
MEVRFGHDFGRVRVHADREAGSSALAVGARAYTVGDQIVFGPGQYTPATAEGRRLLAHELTHVLQQRQGASSGWDGPGTGEDDQAEREARSLADQVMAGTLPARPEVGTAARSLQRFRAEDCTPVEEPAVNDAAATAQACIATVRTVITGGPPAPDVTDALTTYFGQSGPASAPAIAASLETIADGLADATAVCWRASGRFSPIYDLFCGGAAGHTFVGPGIGGYWNIHICQPQFHTLPGPVQQMSTMIHEGAHRFLSMGPEAHASYTLPGCQQTAATRALTDAQRLVNPDSYACLVETLC